MDNYKIGDKVEILGRKSTEYFVDCMPKDVLFMDEGDAMPSPDESIWTPVTIYKITSSEILVSWASEEHTWYVTKKEAPRFLRPFGAALHKVTSNMATSCVECHTTFMYPVEHNCDQGRLCYGCKTTKAWKYTNLRS
jgi:hypothetical protein